MSKGKYSNSHGFNVRPLVLMLAVALLIGATIGGTIAWLTASTKSVENTFTVGNINIKLEEEFEDETLDATTEEQEASYKMVPGNVIEKDPQVTVVGGSEDCWLFVKVTESSTLGTYIDYVVGTGNDDVTTTDVVEGGWTKYEVANAPVGVTYYYRTVAAKTADQVFGVIGYNTTEDSSSVFNAGKVLVKTSVTKKDMDDLSAATAVQPTLTFEAAAVQQANITTVAAAWAELPSAFKPTTTGSGTGA